MDLSGIGRAALKAREGDVLTAYKDSVGVWTIGVGVTTASGLIKVVPGLRITQAQSDALFIRAVEKYVDPVRKALRSDRAFPQEFFDACCSLAYNIGPVRFAESTIVRRANAGDLGGAIEAFLMWNKPAAIISRRQGERDQAATPYSKALPKARRGDKSPVKVPAGAAISASAPRVVDPLAPMTGAPSPLTGEKQIDLSLTKADPLNTKPAPTGGLVRSGVQATGGAVRSGLAGLYDLIHTSFRKA
ncbi:lysozyme [Methylorubrum sp. Q1]|uniref:lysozyme n=1 Tax=Methylorubrum sp. Q1 TaxID=2562453 RepID=UPI0010761223|nr:lysozyme [Methylorubrum sp. Q1]TFZ58304.1 lysozyme [Methylorubrum sp. Q1]